MRTTLPNLAFLTIMLVNFVIVVQYSQAQSSTEELITPVVIDRLSMSTKAQTALRRVQDNAFYSDVQFVRMGNLAKIQRNGQLSFSLPGRIQKLTATATRVVAKSELDYDWYGELMNGVGHLSILCRDGKITANISVGDRLYEIYHLDNDTYALLNTVLDPRKSDCSTKRSLGTPLDPLIEAKPQQTESKNARSAYVNQCNSFVRVLVLYTPAARTLVGDINQTINMCISNFNSCVYNADVTSQVVVELAGQAELNFQESGDIEGDVGTRRLLAELCQD